MLYFLPYYNIYLQYNTFTYDIISLPALEYNLNRFYNIFSFSILRYNERVLTNN